MKLVTKYITLVTGMEIICKIDEDIIHNERYELHDPCFVNINRLADFLPNIDVPRLTISKMNPWIKPDELSSINARHVITITNVDEIIERYYEGALIQLNEKQELARQYIAKERLKKSLGQPVKNFLIEEEDEDSKTFEKFLQELEEDDDEPEEEDNSIFRELLGKKKYIN